MTTEDRTQVFQFFSCTQCGLIGNNATAQHSTSMPLYELAESPPPDPHSPAADVLGRLALLAPTAIEVSRNLWPDRLEGTQDIPGYLKWHEQVRPGGSVHRNNGSDQQDDLHVRGKSIKDISQMLILMMDDFHRKRLGLDPVTGSSSQEPTGAGYDQIESLGQFFNSVRGYGM